MNRFQSLKTFIKSLTTSEKRACHKFLKVTKEKENKCFQLFQMLEHSGKVKKSDISMALYGSSSFTRLQLHLRDKIIEVLTKENSRQFGKRNELSLERIQIRHELNYAEVLLSRKQFVLAQATLEAIEHRAAEYELFNEVLASLHLQVRYAILTGDIEFEKNLYIEILDCCQRKTEITAAQQILATMRMGFATEISESLQKVKECFKKAKSITFSFLMLSIDVLEIKQKGNYNKAEKILKQQLEMTSKFPALKDWRIKGEIYLELAKNAIKMKEAEKASGYLINAEGWLDDYESSSKMIDQIRDEIAKMN